MGKLIKKKHVLGDCNAGVTQAGPILVFECMSKVDVLWACFSALTGKTVLYIKKPRRVARPLLIVVFRLRFFRRRIRRYRIAWNKDLFDGMWTARAFSVIDDVYAKIAPSRFARILWVRFGYAAELSVKKELTTHLSRFFYIDSLLSFLNERFDSRIVFVPAQGIRYSYYVSGAHEAIYYGFLSRFLREAGLSGSTGHENVCFSIFTRMRGMVSYCVEVIGRNARMVARIVKYFCIALKNALFPMPERSWRYGVMIMSLDRQFHNNSEGLDFLIDGIRIKKEEMVFITHSFLRLGKRELDYIKRKKLNYIYDLHDYYSLSSWFGMVWTWIQTFFGGPLFLLKIGHALSVEWALWESFSSRVHLDHVIGHHDVSVSALCRNILLEERQGTKSWLYLDAFNFWSLFIPDDGKTNCEVNFFSFMRYNYFVCWNKKMVQVLSTLHNRVDVCYQFGCLWSTFIKRQKEIARREESGAMCTLVVFDSSYHDYSMTKPRDAYFFYKGILRLLEEMVNVRVLMKPKKSWGLQEHTYEDRSMFFAIDKLVRHPRCKVMDYTTPRGEIIAQADLVIAYPFTSPAFEAVCAGFPAVYFDATGAFPSSAYQGCGMVASGYMDLIKKVKYFLEMPRFDFYQWRQAHQSVFDDFLDGRGLDRFIEELVRVS